MNVSLAKLDSRGSGRIKFDLPNFAKKKDPAHVKHGRKSGKENRRGPMPRRG